MIQEMADRISIGWSRKQLSRASDVSVASIYLLERMGTAGPEDDLRIRTVLARLKTKHGRQVFDLGFPQNEKERLAQA